MIQRYLINVEGDVEPFLEGPFTTGVEQLEAAEALYREHGEENGIFWLDIDWESQDIEVGSFSGQFFEDVDEGEE